MPDGAPLTFDEQELALAQICLKARGWRVSDSRLTDSELVIIATRPRTPPNPIPPRNRDLT